MHNIYKDPFLYDIIKENITAFGKKNDINGVSYMAEVLGLCGKTKNIQLYKRLSSNETTKFIKLDELLIMLGEMDKEEQKSILDALVSKFGFFIKPTPKADETIQAVEVSMQIGVLEIQGMLGLLADEVVADLEDGVIDEKEAKRIKRIAMDMRKQLRAIENKLDEFIG
ncbi:MAG: hypothetical protein GXP61_08140 [Epsilonproteobacteria bacterium]|nr:hypothetical protein [Campylobacterota bacterium]